ncbi:L-threonine ammonia-lyase-like isoform X2 [Aricia agestis]|uniref:L-threonine ammonia-lyase-like isoform X2 n=1 Tax=Aricia agestis TaxID=91739 RepID=UPI001C20AFBD|nr:L-threonine ammonia-lyase-like isoform X2 [Aricia agestis]
MSATEGDSVYESQPHIICFNEIKEAVERNHDGIIHTPLCVTVVMPERTPSASSQRCAELGADVILYGESTDDVIQYATKINSDFNHYLISPDDPEVIAGLGTVGIEIITQLPETDAVIVPVGGGALLAGTIVACKKLKCSCLVYGAECAKVPTMMKSLQAGKPVKVSPVTNLAQGLNASVVGDNAFATIKGRLDRMLLVDESYIAKAIISVLERERLVVDGAGVCALAAVMQGLVPELRGKRTVCILSGGNIDSGLLARTIQRGLGASGRLLRFAVPIPDHRSGLDRVANVLADENAVLKSLVTEQMWVHSDVSSTWGNFVVEVANAEHSLHLKDRIQEFYPSARFAITDVDKQKKN